MLRESSPDAIHLCGRLLRRYMCDQWAKADQRRPKYYRRKQETLREASYRQVQNPKQGAEKGADVGKIIIAPATVAGGPRQMRDLYQDAMAAVRTYGRPHLFITFTRSPEWPEIREPMPPKQHAGMRPDFAARVFRIKLAAIAKNIYAAGGFGRKVARLCVVEFQKRMASACPHNLHPCRCRRSDDH